jgi:hypothetical protein
MTSEKDLELLDQYVGNRMSAHDKAVFEKKLAADKELHTEYRLQQKIVEGVRKARATELKKMLNDIPVANLPTDGTPLLTQVGIWVIVAGLVGTGAYFYFAEDGTSTHTPLPPSAVVTPDTKPANTTPAEDSPEPAAQSTDDIAATREQESASRPQVAVPKAETPVDEVKVQPVTPAPLDVFDPTEEMKNTEGTNAVAEEGETGESTAPSIVVETADDKRYSFHYQFKNDKLYLYGSFEKNLYEIMEFFSDNKRTMFLFYKENYYLLNEDSEKVKALTPISDETLVKKLRDYRGN